MELEELKPYFRKVAADKKAIGFIMALQPTRPNENASMEDVFQLAKSQGFALSAFVIVRPYRDRKHACWSEPSVAIQRLSRKGIRVGKLDARTGLPHRNARAIRRVLDLKLAK